MDIEPISLCRIVDKLEEAKLVERRRDPGDRRAWQLYLRDSAAPLVLKLHALGQDFSADVFGNLDPADVERVSALLATIRDNLSNTAPRTKASA
jgi:DNA-binding MarR family transcriptional regulator